MLTDEHLASALGLKLPKIYHETQKRANASLCPEFEPVATDIAGETTSTKRKRLQEEVDIDGELESGAPNWRASLSPSLGAPARAKDSAPIVQFGSVAYLIVLFIMAACVFGLEMYRIREVSQLASRVDHLYQEMENARSPSKPRAFEVSKTDGVGEIELVRVVEDKKVDDKADAVVKYEAGPRAKRSPLRSRHRQNNNEQGCRGKRRSRSLQQRSSFNSGPRYIHFRGLKSIAGGIYIFSQPVTPPSYFFTYDITSGKVTIDQPGSYYVYAKIFYTGNHNLGNGYDVLVNGQSISQCARRALRKPKHSRAVIPCYSRALTVLKKGDEVFVRDRLAAGTEENIQAVNDNKSFFGIVKISP